MLKVLIADDEERVCKLIRALIDWDCLDLEFVGFANNGFEAIDLVKKLTPDILITDIRMPGCDGMQLIQSVRENNQYLEIIIISGYAHFDYAQNAIRNGVGEYLLKPISKTDLNKALNNLCQKIKDRDNLGNEALIRYKNNERDLGLLRTRLIDDVINDEHFLLDIQSLINVYHFTYQSGFLQGICITADCPDETSQTVIDFSWDRVQGIIRNIVNPLCFDLVMSPKESGLVLIINYDERKRDEIRKAIWNCLNELMPQKSLLGNILFTIALGPPVKEPQALSRSIHESIIISKERYVKGTEILLETMPTPSGISKSQILERYTRSISTALEMFDEEMAKKAVDEMEFSVLKDKNAAGYEICELIQAAGNIFLIHYGFDLNSDEPQKEDPFSKNSSDVFHSLFLRCSSAEELFDSFRKWQTELIIKEKEGRENDLQRPVRKAKQYIDVHYSEPITLEEVSNFVGLSASYFSVLFKKTTGEGFAKYLIRYRIEQAKILLRETNEPVSAICKAVGYNDVKHFTETFVKTVEIKPGTYRKLYG